MLVNLANGIRLLRAGEMLIPHLRSGAIALRSLLLATLPFILLASTAPPAVSAEPAVTVPLHLRAPGDPAKPAADNVRNLAIQLLESSSLDSVTRVPQIQARYRQVAAGECLVITYASPVSIRTAGGDVSVFEIVIGMGRPDYADALFTIDATGRVVTHEKYSGSIAAELRKAADVAVGAR